jgi:NAD(P)-dependent dehydrogenase (short-subunit alcohol dehydrogenase family)
MLGKACVLVFAEAGANVMLTARKWTVMGRLLQLDRLGVKTIAVKTDVSSEKDCEQFIKATTKEFGNVDILVNNSGATWGAAFLKHPLKRWQKVMDVNLMGTFLFSHEVAKSDGASKKVK